MLKQRIITGVILIIVAIFGLLVLPFGNYFVAFISLVLALGIYEWNKMAKIPLLLNAILIVALLAFTTYIWANWFGFFLLYFNKFVLVSLVFWAALILSLAFFPNKKSYLDNQILRILIGLLLLGITLLSMIFIKSLGNSYLIFVALTIIFADTGAFFAGRKFGKHKLAPNISPGKTWEGLLGALVLNSIFAIVFANFFAQGLIFSKNAILLNSLSWILLAWAISIMSAIGDLFESMIKRVSGVKDSSNILPGHGGVLDRLDGFTAALPTFTICLFLFQKFAI